MNYKNKRIISILIASGILLSPSNVQAMKSTIDLINEDLSTIQNKKVEQNEYSTNIIADSVYEIEIGDGEFVPDLTNNPHGYETIKVKTTGNKKLVVQDYANLRNSCIPKIDLSSAQSDSISAGAFNSSSALKEFKFPKGITSIGDEAFMNCIGLTGNLELPNTVTTIGRHAFYSCSGFSGKLKLPNSLTSIGERAFVSCSGFSGDLVIPDSVTTIGDNAFTYCDGFNGNLKLSNSLKSIGPNAFVALKGLSGELTIPDSVEFIGESAFEGCTGFSGDLVLPSSLTSLSDGVFAGCTGFNGTLKLPDTLETIGFATFNGCNGFKGKLIIPNSVKTIGNRAFRDCTGFSGDLVIPDSVTTVGSHSFNNCKGFNGELKLGNSVTDIGVGAFYECSGLTGELKLPNSINNIGMYAFNECSGFTGNLVIPNSLATLGNNAFRNVNIDKIFIKVNSEDEATDYRKSIIDVLPTKAKIIIDTPYDFDISKTWLENTDKIIAKPIVKNLVNGVESELVNGKGDKVSLYIPSIYEESNITVLKDGKTFNLPTKNHDDKYIFTEDGNYEIRINTSLGNVSVINFEVKNEVINIDKESPKIDYKLSTNDWTNENVTITVNASDNVDIEKIILPDNSEINASTTTYEVSQNGDYEFTAVDKSGNRKNIIVNVSNIDKESPLVSYKIIKDKGDSVIVEFEMTDSLSGIKSIINDKGLTALDENKFELMKNVQYTFTVSDNARNRVIKEVLIKHDIQSTKGIVYQTHVQDYGWQNWKSNGEMSGTSGEAKRLEGIRIKINDVLPGANILYRTHVEDYGWQDWKSNGEMSGTSGEAKRLEGIEIKLENAPGYKVEYRVHVQDYGWQDWKSDGEMAGTSGEAKRLEAIEIRIVKDTTPDIQYRTHVQDYGWQDWKSNGEMSGTSGESKRLEGIEIKLENAPIGANIVYQTHVEDYGWQEWKSNGQMSGTSGESKRLEGIRIKLENAPGYKVEYRVHIQDYGWQDWKSDGEMAGTSGEAKRLEGIEVRIVKK